MDSYRLKTHYSMLQHTRGWNKPYISDQKSCPGYSNPTLLLFSTGVDKISTVDNNGQMALWLVRNKPRSTKKFSGISSVFKVLIFMISGSVPTCLSPMSNFGFRSQLYVIKQIWHVYDKDKGLWNISLVSYLEGFFFSLLDGKHTVLRGLTLMRSLNDLFGCP